MVHQTEGFYESAVNPVQLASRSDLVIAGSVREVLVGREVSSSGAADDNLRYYTLVVEGRPLGARGVSGRDTFFVEVQDGGIGLGGLERVFERELEVVLFATDTSGRSPSHGFELSNPLGGRPSLDVALYTALRQGVLIVDDEGVLGFYEDVRDFGP
jgi:hypothetical protein